MLRVEYVTKGFRPKGSRLTFIKKVGTGISSGHKHSIVLMKCDCGFILKGRWGDFSTGNRTRMCKDCGIKYITNIRKLPSGVAARNLVIQNYTRHAKDRNIEWKLSNILLDVIFKGICYYCGQLPSNIQKSKNGEFIYSGIDRINNDRGYVPNNVVSSCQFCNRCKSDLSSKNFLDKIEKIYKFRIAKDA